MRTTVAGPGSFYLSAPGGRPRTGSGLLASGATAIAYETVTAADGSLPLLTPMSRVAGRMSIQAGAHHLEKSAGGAGILLGGVCPVCRRRTSWFSGRVSRVEMRRRWRWDCRRQVVVIDKSVQRLESLAEQFGNRVQTAYSTAASIEEHVTQADLVIGCVLVPGAATPRLVSRELLMKMRPGSVVVDVSIDQGGCFETSRPTTHSAPTYVEEGIVHYCVTNMPGAVPRTEHACAD